MKVRFDYDIAPKKSADLDPRDFTNCETFGEFMDELTERAPEPEWSVYQSKDDAAKLWAEVQERQREIEKERKGE